MKYCLYTHIGSGNRGCEATARALQNLLNVSKECFWVFSENNEEENICNTESYATVLYTPMVQGLHPMTSLVPRLLTKLNIDRLAGVRYRYKKLFKGIESDDIGLSTGGDVFCYDQELSNKIGYLTKEFNKKANRTYLIACSIEEKNLTPETIKILKQFKYIFPRESITERHLKKVGFKNVKLYPDPAFALPIEPIKGVTLRDNREYIGINYSIYVNGGTEEKKRFEIIIQFIRNVLDNTKMDIILIPHVYWKEENDVIILKKIKEHFLKEDRVILLQKRYKSTELKYVISKCRFFLGARTHSVIGAYSSGVPTLALGYSIKSKGIAKDIFGDFESYVIDFTKLENYEELSGKFKNIVDHEEEIKDILKIKNNEYKNLLKKQIEFIRIQT